MAGQEGFEPPTPGFGVRCSTIRATGLSIWFLCAGYELYKKDNIFLALTYAVQFFYFLLLCNFAAYNLDKLTLYYLSYFSPARVTTAGG